MLSYQHIFHAGNLADVHKHALLAWALDYLTQKDKPLSYLETHAGRGLYQLDAAEAVKTGEAKAGIEAVSGAFDGHPYGRALSEIREAYGPNAYPGSPMVAASLLRRMDNIRLAELHPQEHAALAEVMRGKGVVDKADGFQLALSVTPPEPRRGLMLVDPPYEVKTDYERLPELFKQVAKKWNVGVLMLWYPILTSAPHAPMLRELQRQFPDGLRSEVSFPPAREGHRMVGSGMFIVNPPWGMEAEAQRLERLFQGFPSQG